MFVGELADPKAGDHVIDVCAAPGGKSLHVAEKLQLADEVAARENGTEEKTGRVEARDLTEYKTDLIWQNIGPFRTWKYLCCMQGRFCI